MWFTWANLLTAIRLALAVPCAMAVVSGDWPLAAALFALAVITDLLDGPLARRLNHASRVGGLFDHATDALFVTCTLGGLATAGYLTWALPCLVAAAFMQYALDSRALAGKHLRTSYLGRMNGIAYFFAAGIPIVKEGLALPWPSAALIQGLAWVLVLTSIVSMGDRARAWLLRSE
jgi:phosphatidylglycerophosphate synthase